MANGSKWTCTSTAGKAARVYGVTAGALVEFVQHHLDEAIEQAGESPDLDSFDHVYRTVLVEVIALSHAVLPPEGHIQSGPALA